MPGGLFGWAILLTAVGVFILLNLFRNKEEARRRRPPARGPRPIDADDPSGRRQEPVTDFDRYLQDFQRRRRTSGTGEQKPRPQPPVRPAQPVQNRPRRAAPESERRSPTRSSVDSPLARQSASGPLQTEVIPYAIPVGELAPPPRVTLEPIRIVPAKAFPVTPPAPRAARGVGAAPLPRPVAKDESFLALLQSRQTLRNVIILREILDPPLSKRRRV
jgi:hypothetical protein